MDILLEKKLIWDCVDRPAPSPPSLGLSVLRPQTELPPISNVKPPDLNVYCILQHLNNLNNSYKRVTFE